MRRNQYIGLTVLALAVLLVIYKVRGQSFGSFNHDQPYLVGPVTSSANTNLFPLVDLYWRWVASDISSNANVMIWKDRKQGVNLVATNSGYSPTNDSYGLYFNNARLTLTNPAIEVYTNSMFVVFNRYTNENYRTAAIEDAGYLEPLIGDQTSVRNGFYFRTNSLVVVTNGQPSSTYLVVWPSVPTNQTCTVITKGSAIYTNGVFAASVSAVPTYFLNIGGWVGAGGSGVPASHYYIDELAFYTNIVTDADVSNLNYYAFTTYSSNRTKEFQPQEVAGMRSWWRADRGTEKDAIRTPLAVGDKVSYWRDAGAFQNDLIAAGDANGFLEIAGFSHINFRTNGANGSWNNATCFSWAQPYTYFLIFQYTNDLSGASGQVPVGAYTAPQPFLQLKTNASGATITQGANSAQEYSCQTITNWTIVTACFNGASSFLRTNKVLRADGFNVGNADLCAAIIANHSGSVYGFKGKFAEWLVYQGIPSTNDIQRIENWLATRYGL